MKDKKLISFKAQYIIGLIPVLGVVIVSIIGMRNIINYKKNVLHGVLYYFLTLIPLMFAGVIIGVCALLIVNETIFGNNVVLQKTLVCAIGYIVVFCAVYTNIGIQKTMIERFKKKEENRTENNLF